MKILPVVLLAATVLASTQCTQKAPDKSLASSNQPAMVETPPADLAQYHRATFAAGCFWCEEAVFESIKGVAEVISGYSGGQEANPTYEQVGSGDTGHAESVEVYYDSSQVDYPTLLRVFLASEDPTQVNGQGPDWGTQYRSIIFYRNDTERQQAGQALSALQQSGKYNKPIVVQVVPFQRFWPAEDYHQNYVQNHPQNGYVLQESLPRLRRTQQQVPELLKPERTIIGQ